MVPADRPPPPTDTHWRLFPAVAIIAIGVLFLANNLGYPLSFLTHGNWWALFILVAALAPATRAFELYRSHGRVDGAVTYYLVCTAAVVLVSVMFLANLDWGVWWPLFLILAGVCTLVRRPYCVGRYRATGRAWDDAPKPPEH